jgi:hypothetical protein
MHYIYIFFFSFVKFLYLYHIGIILLFCLYVLVLVLKKPLKKNVKINYFYTTHILAISYVLFYVILFLSLRFLQLGKDLDLKKYYISINLQINHLIEQSAYNKIIYLSLFFLIILVWLILFFKCRQYLSWQLWQVYFYHKHKYLLIQKETNNIKELIDKLFFKYSYYTCCHKITYKIIQIAEAYKFTKLYNFLNTSNIFFYFFRYFFFFLLVVIFLYECLINNFILNKTLYYLLFYFIFVIWYRLSYSCTNEDFNLDKIIFEMNYCANKIVYVNVSENDIRELILYIEKPYLLDKTKVLTDIIFYPPEFSHVHKLVFFNRFVFMNLRNFQKLLKQKQNYSSHEYHIRMFI